jgi:hypothetical protein
MQALVLCRQPSRKARFVVKRQQNQQSLGPSLANLHSSTIVWNLASRSTRTHPSTNQPDQPYNSMDSKLIDVWQAAAGNPFLPTVGKGTQFLVAFVLLLLGLFSFGIFALSKKPPLPTPRQVYGLQANECVLQTGLQSTCPSLESQLLWPSRTSLPAPPLLPQVRCDSAHI